MKQVIVPFIYIFIYIFILLPACTNNKHEIITYDLKRSDYVEAIDATGTIQAVNNIVLVAPRVNVSGVTVGHLTEEGSNVKKGDTVCILEAPELVNLVESYNTDLEKLKADMKKLEADNAMQLALLKAQVETNNAQLAISMLDSIQLKFAPPVKQRLLELEMEKTNVEKRKLQKKFASQKRIDNSELMQMRSQIMMQENRIQIYQNQINSLILLAPGDGIVLHCESPIMRFIGSGVGTRGGKIEEKSSVWSNMPLLQFPDIKVMQVSVEVPESDYKRIKELQKVLIRIEAAANLYTTGKIKRKLLAGKSSQESTGIKIYEVIISVDSCYTKMKPGLSANCQIIVNQMKDTIVVPAAAIFGKDSLKIVYVADGDLFIPVTVETGFSNSSKSIITKGLSGNETVALAEPPHNLIRKEPKPKSKSEKTIKPALLKNDSLVKISGIKN